MQNQNIGMLGQLSRKRSLISLASLWVALLLLILSGRATIQIGLIPITLQSLAVTSLPFFLPRGHALGAILLWLCLGGMGAPFFSNGTSGINVLMGRTGGYLVGMGVATAYLEWTLLRPGSIRYHAFAIVIANAIILGMGLLQLGTQIGFSGKLLDVGLSPFLPGCGIKIGIAIALAYLASRINARIRLSKHAM